MRNRARTPAVVNFVGTLSLIAIIVPLALRAGQSSPPAIAEFAPEAQHTIHNAPLEQTGSFGAGAGAATGAAATPSPNPSPSPLPNGATFLRCVGDPPRQIEDPQSPPCVPYWVGRNGGKTYKGVDGQLITIGYPDYSDSSSPSEWQMLQKFFNERFEFYGRQIQFVDMTGRATDNPADSEAAAQAADNSSHIFASTASGKGANYQYYVDLAKEGLISASERPTFTAAEMSQYAPYLWTYPMAQDQMFGNLGEWACGRLAGRPAGHAAGTDLETPPQQLQAKKRVFGLVVNTDDATWQVPDSTPLRDQLAKCGATIAKEVDHAGLIDPNATAAENEVLQMDQAGVTSIFCLCQVAWHGLLAQAADKENYFPEWLISSYLLEDQAFDLKTFVPADQLTHSFGLTFQPMQESAANQPACWARKEANQGDTCGSGNALSLATTELVYRCVLLLASGIQMAGPDLTPANFQAGLERSVFPNPETPLMAGHVGFNGGSHGMTVDGAEFWYSPTTPGPYTGDTSAMCYVDGGRRYASGQWPQGGDPFEQYPCFVGR